MSDTPVTPPKPAAKPKSAAKSTTAANPETTNPATAAPSGDAAQPTWVKVGVGVGSAALVAALLYVTRSKRNDWTK